MHDKWKEIIDNAFAMGNHKGPTPNGESIELKG